MDGKQFQRVSARLRQIFTIEKSIEVWPSETRTRSVTSIALHRCLVARPRIHTRVCNVHIYTCIRANAHTRLLRIYGFFFFLDANHSAHNLRRNVPRDRVHSKIIEVPRVFTTRRLNQLRVCTKHEASAHYLVTLSVRYQRERFIVRNDAYYDVAAVKQHSFCLRGQKRRRKKNREKRDKYDECRCTRLERLSMIRERSRSLHDSAINRGIKESCP